MRRAFVAAAAVLGALCIGPAAAVAHPLLVQAAPSPGLVAPRAPEAIQLAFTEPAVARGSSIVVRGARGARVAVGPIQSQNGGRTLTITPVQRLRSAVYSVRWVALGNDGHTVSGDFSFGVAGAHGRAPAGAERLQGQVGAGGSGSESANAESPLAVAVRWAGIVAASFLAAGVLLALLATLPAAARWDRWARPAVAVLLIAAAIGALSAAKRGGGGFDASLLTASPNGRVALGRLAFAVLLAAPALRWRRVRSALGLGGLASYALAGHVLSSGSTFEYAVQLVHVLAAGLWLGGVLLFALVVGAAVPDERRAALRAFAPVAAALLVLAIGAGVLAAVREVDGWYFLRWSTYGRVVLIKSALVAVVVALAAFATLRARRNPSARIVRVEALALLGVVALAVVLSGIAQGRGQLLPAERGTMLPGPAVASAIVRGGSANIVLAPARAGLNTVAVTLGGGAKPGTHFALRLSCECAKQPVIVPLAKPGHGGAWSASVDLPKAGAWFAYPTVGSRSSDSPALLRVGVPEAPGSEVRDVVSIADLSGPDAQRCRDHELGLQLALGRINSAGGVDGGNKIAPYVLDDGGDPAEARALAQSTLKSGKNVAFVPCGAAATAAIGPVAAKRIPTIVGDPAVAPVQARRVFRAAGDPYAEGYATGQYLTKSVEQGASPSARRILTLRASDAIGQRFERGLEAGLGANAKLRIEPIAAAQLTRHGARLLDRRRTLALVLDGPNGAGYTPLLHELSDATNAIPPAPVVASARVLSEELVEGAGELGRVGGVEGMTEVTPDSADALVYTRAVPAIFPGQRPSLDGLRGYVAGLALRAAFEGGTDAAGVAKRLTRPKPFTDALDAPWRADAPAAGGVRFTALAPSFLSANLIPVSAGGESYDGTYFTDGAWTRPTTNLFGPPLQAPVPAF